MAPDPDGALPPTGRHTWFNGDCTYYSYVNSTVYVNSDGSLTVGTTSGPHIFERI